MKRIITLYLEQLDDAKDKVKRALKKLDNGDEIILISKADVSYLFKGYSVEKGKNDDGTWIIRIKRN